MGLYLKENIRSILNDMVNLSQRSLINSPDNPWQYILIDYNKDIVFTGGGDNIFLSAITETEGEGNYFKAVVDLKRFFEAIKFMGKDTEINLEDSQVVLKKGQKIVRLQISNDLISPYLPVMPREMFKKEGDERIYFTAKELEILKKFVMEDILRPALCRISALNRNGSVYFAATDSFKLCELQTNKCNINKSYLLRPIIPFSIDEDIYIHTIRGFTIFSSFDRVIYQLNIQEMFPDYYKIINSLEGSLITVNVKDLLFSLRSFVAFDSRPGSLVDISIKDNKMKLISSNINSKHSDRVFDTISVKNNDMEINMCMQTQYFADIIDGYSKSEGAKDEVNLYFNNKVGIYIKEKDKVFVALGRN